MPGVLAPKEKAKRQRGMSRKDDDVKPAAKYIMPHPRPWDWPPDWPIGTIGADGSRTMNPIHKPGGRSLPTASSAPVSSSLPEGSGSMNPIHKSSTQGNLSKGNLSTASSAPPASFAEAELGMKRNLTVGDLSRLLKQQGREGSLASGRSSPLGGSGEQLPVSGNASPLASVTVPGEHDESFRSNGSSELSEDDRSQPKLLKLRSIRGAESSRVAAADDYESGRASDPGARKSGRRWNMVASWRERRSGQPLPV